MGSRARSEERKKRKKKRNKQQQLDPSSSSPSSSSSTDVITSSEERRKSTKRKPRQSTSPSQSEYGRLKHKKRRHSRRAEKAEKYSRRENSSKKAHHKSQTDEGRASPSPQEVAYTFLIKFPDLAADLVQLLKMLDDGQAVDLSGLANDHVKAYLKQLFQSLLLQRTTHGLYFLPDGAPRKTLHVLSSVVSSSENINDSAQAVEKKEEIHVLKDTVQISNEDGCNDQYGPIEKQRRVLGPVMPSTEVLEAAARMMEADQSLRLSGSAKPSTEILEDAARMTEAGPTLREAHEDILLAPFIGPPPPAAVKEAESANEAERFEEVERILAPDVENAYELLGLRVGASAELLKKRYWKISLLVHPDKCGHPQAHQAFTALNQAFKDLQDPVKRAKVDEQIQEKETRKEFEAEVRKNREAAQWRKIRGESLPGDDALLDQPKAMVREEWMTQLPPERKPGAPAQQSMFFSKYGKSGRGDSSAWTDTPMDRIQKAKMMSLEGQKLATMKYDEEVAFCKEDTNPVTARIVDEFNSAKRGMSLLEKHEMECSKKKKKAFTKQEAQQPPEWVGSHPWKPWDREKDLTAGRQKVNLDKSNMAEGLSSRFASAHKERSFL